jgi:HK97 family phage major capsid protein
MKTIKEIEARRSAIEKEIEQRGEIMSPEELSAFEAEIGQLEVEQKAALDALDKRKALLDNIAAGKEGVKARAFKPDGGVSADEDDDRFNSKEYRKIFKDYVLRGTPIPIEYRANEMTMTTDVGAVIPTEVLNTIIQKLESTGMILPLITRTAYKGGLTVPISSVKPVATGVAEGTGSDTQKQPIGSISFSYYKLRCAVAVDLEADTMSIPAFESLLIANIAEAMIKALEQSIINGTGTGQPKGILAETPAAGQSVSVAAPAYEDLVDAEAALPLAYEPGAVWCMTKKTFMSYFGLVDAAGQPIGRVNYGITSTPERTLLGRRVVLCDYMPSWVSGMAANTVFAFLFNFRDYALNTNYNMGLRKYEDNPTDNLVTKAVMLVDGKVVDKNSLVTLKAA